MLLFSVECYALQAKGKPRPKCSEGATPQTPVLSPEQFSDVIQKSQRLLSLLRAAQGLLLENKLDIYALEIILNSSF